MFSDNGGVGHTPGLYRLGEAAAFSDGNYLSIDYPAGNMHIRATDAFYSFWLYTAGSSSEAFLYFDGALSGSNAGLLIVKNSSNYIRIYFCDGSASRINLLSSAILPLSQWVHCVINIDRDGNLEYFQDGVSRGTLDISAQSGDIHPLNGAYLSHPAGHLTGNMQQFLKGNHKLTQVEISKLYNNRNGIAYPFV